jgi:hypothetical protein
LALVFAHHCCGSAVRIAFPPPELPPPAAVKIFPEIFRNLTPPPDAVDFLERFRKKEIKFYSQRSNILLIFLAWRSLVHRAAPLVAPLPCPSRGEASFGAGEKAVGAKAIPVGVRDTALGPQWLALKMELNRTAVPPSSWLEVQPRETLVFLGDKRTSMQQAACGFGRRLRRGEGLALGF